MAENLAADRRPVTPWGAVATRMAKPAIGVDAIQPRQRRAPQTVAFARALPIHTGRFD